MLLILIIIMGIGDMMGNVLGIMSPNLLYDVAYSFQEDSSPHHRMHSAFDSKTHCTGHNVVTIFPSCAHLMKGTLNNSKLQFLTDCPQFAFYWVWRSKSGTLGSKGFRYGHALGPLQQCMRN